MSKSFVQRIQKNRPFYGLTLRLLDTLDSLR